VTPTKSKYANVLHKCINSRFIRDVGIVGTGTAGAQAIGIAFAPFITRFYGPEALGFLGAFLAIVSILNPVAAFTYPIAIVLPREDGEARDIALLSSLVALGNAFVIAVILLVSGDFLVELLNLQAMSAFILLVPLVMLFSAWLQIVQQWLIRKKKFNLTAQVAVLQALIVNGAKTGIGVFKPLAAVLIVISAVGTLIHFLMLGIGAKRSGLPMDGKSFIDMNPSSWAVAKKYYDFPVYRAPQTLINAVSQSLPVLMLAAFFGPTSAGFYALCLRVLRIPGQLIATSVSQVFYPRIAEAEHKGENLTRLIVKTTAVLALVGFIPLVPVVAIGPWLFGFVFGPKWVVAGEYARWLAFWIFFAFINRPSLVSIPVLRLQGFLLVCEIVSIVLRLLALLAGFYLFKSDILAIALFSFAGAIFNLSVIIMSIWRSHFMAKEGTGS